MSASLDEPGSTQEFETLVQYIRNKLGFDFTGSKRSSLRRCVGKHMQSLRIPKLIAGKQPHEPIRVWSAGCVSGQEAYSLAMVLAEALGLESFRQRVKIHMWNAEANELWGLLDDEVLDQSLVNLDIGLSVEQLRTPVRAVLTGRATFQDVVLEATRRLGKALQCRITCSPLVGAEQDTQGVILLMEEWCGHA